MSSSLLESKGDTAPFRKPKSYAKAKSDVKARSDVKSKPRGRKLITAG